MNEDIKKLEELKINIEIWRFITDSLWGKLLPSFLTILILGTALLTFVYIWIRNGVILGVISVSLALLALSWAMMSYRIRKQELKYGEKIVKRQAKLKIEAMIPLPDTLIQKIPVFYILEAFYILIMVAFLILTVIFLACPLPELPQTSL